MLSGGTGKHRLETLAGIVKCWAKRMVNVGKTLLPTLFPRSYHGGVNMNLR